MPETYLTVTSALRHEPDKTKGSRHVATVIPLQDEGEVPAHLERVARELPKANHHAHAWRLGRGKDRYRYEDDGEPSGSAGRPILQQIDGRGLTNLLVVVTRYFGGTKLGVGGLVRAYGGACAEALDRADILTVIATQRVTIIHGYDDSSPVSMVLAASGLAPVESGYDERVTLHFDVPESQVEGFVAGLREGTAGRASIEIGPAAR